ncbi:MAG: TetR family transcriptional regulator, partial [Pseudomonadota bacterium]|nr:TetR family transcriptional regulator [Pseudomonadota bacterium]
MSKSEGQTITKSARAFSPTTQKRREKALLEKRTRIMDAALSLFSKNGVSGTTVEQVSELANVSKSNLLYYFKCKEGLYLSFITHLLDVWLTPLQSFSAEQDPIETLSDYIKVKLEMSRD